MNKPTLFILCGQAFSGKSTLANEIAKRFGAEIVGRDRIYFALAEMLALEETPDDEDDKLWSDGLWSVAVQGTRNHLLLGRSVVFDDVCLRRAQRDELRDMAGKSGAKVILIYLDIPNNVLKERREKNKVSKERHDIPSEWITDNQNVFEKPAETENPIVYKNDINKSDFLDKITELL